MILVKVRETEEILIVKNFNGMNKKERKKRVSTKFKFFSLRFKLINQKNNLFIFSYKKMIAQT